MSEDTFIGPEHILHHFRRHRWGGRRGFGGHFGKGFGPGFGGGRFFDTGEMRLALLSLIAERPRHGYELMTEMETRSEGVYRPSPGAIYPNLQQLEDQGMVTSHKEDGKTVYTITDAGKTEVERQREAIGDIWAKTDEAGEWGPFASPAGMEIARSVKDFARTAFIAVSKRKVDPDKIREIINEARGKVEKTRAE
jgi:DNA-binding PadR family transcriptional regulator